MGYLEKKLYDEVGRCIVRINKLEDFERQQKEVNKLIIERFAAKIKEMNPPKLKA